MKKNRFSQASNRSESKGEVRIIAGLWRGRKLPVLHLQGLRPTGDRVKETLFNWLAPYVVDAVCLDCFSGSGSLGFEALSRQAKQVTFLELDRNAAQQLKQNLHALKCSPEQASVFNQDCLQFLNQMQNTPHFDLVFIDPPFHFDLVEKTVRLLDQHHWLRPDALIYIETEREKPLDVPPHWQLLKEKTTGMVSYRLYQNSSSSI
ncbi:16S rRNA (guanine(966)-N(2))-methyltransferase RsmD [Caviibacterium pharyngocola]|uniref:Ribosomal RNA small subunit methyltransferase D n=1 Tax=Caviibacterium pharyngocola TaxID=28159 RepID=A0A2M8RXK2_9PAST|nr:16S rRNA (guanine(966)-N(2))-methyltransferase RsmD [Caviibacterium pharyngocola]PJG83619.1 16S rRNA (guanine(966)-N(2))-methyltransferase RsmD [Caviibacterium pharyngocola]